MQQEIECKFLNVDHDEIRKRLVELGGECVEPMRMMRRIMFDHADGRFQKNSQHERLRVRDEGDKVTVTYKKSHPESGYPYEVEIIVNSYDDTVQLFENIGLQKYSFQESKRETWHLDSVEVVLDEWPWINRYIEIEGEDEVSIKKVAAKLGFAWLDAKFGSVDVVYRLQHAGFTNNMSVGDVPQVRFGTPQPEWFKKSQK